MSAITRLIKRAIACGAPPEPSPKMLQLRAAAREARALRDAQAMQVVTNSVRRAVAEKTLASLGYTVRRDESDEIVWAASVDARVLSECVRAPA